MLKQNEQRKRFFPINKIIQNIFLETIKNKTKKKMEWLKESRRCCGNGIELFKLLNRLSLK